MPTTVTVITVCLNARRHIEQTIRSVLSQRYRPVEYIIVDGGSTDGTLEVIERHRDRIDRVVSEPDNGIADAMNKGLSLAGGEYILFLHADDYLADDDALADVSRFLGLADIVACPIMFGKNRRLLRPRGFNFWFNFKGIPHQGVLCRRETLLGLGGFDASLSICMDYDLLLRAYRSGATFVKAPVVLSVMRDTGVSSRREWRGLRRRFDEERTVHYKNCPSFPMRIVYSLYWPSYITYRRARYFMERLWSAR